jgi:hypothetical protein
VRGDATLQARLLLRGTGVAGAGMAVGGGLAVVGAYRPWYAVTAELTMLGEDQTRAVAELAGWEAHPWGWVIPAVGLLAVALGVAVAIDRPAARTRLVALVGCGLLAAAVAAGAMLRPGVDRFDIAGSRLRELVDLADRLPEGVELSFAVAVADGVWVTAGAASLVLLGTLGARELPWGKRLR